MPRKRKKKSTTQWKKPVLGLGILLLLLMIYPGTHIPIIRYVWEIRSNFDLTQNYVFGIDVSHYQEEINWEHVRMSKHPIEFVFIRATMGANRKDERFSENWEQVRENGLLRGAYHYYDPRQNSELQANNFIESVRLDSGDFPPVLDIEELSPYGNDNLLRGIKNWLRIVENHYGVKPIVYTGLKFHEDYLQRDIEGYPLWIAAYSYPKEQLNHLRWHFHQFTDKVNVYGIHSRVDGNDFNGTRGELDSLLIR